MKKKISEHVIEIGKIVGVLITLLSIGMGVAKPHIDNYVTSIHKTNAIEENQVHILQIEETRKHLKRLQNDVIYLKFLVIENLSSKQLKAADDKYNAHVKNK